jgi:hypothetical protein
VLATVNQKISPLGSPRVSQVQWDLVLDIWVTNGRITGKIIDVDLNIRKKVITITDNCGGIAEDYLDNLLAPGASQNSPESEIIGIFGVGSKRAVVALGNDIRIRTRHNNSHSFEIDINEDWLDSPGWTIPYYKIDSIKPNTTEIKICDLRIDFDEKTIRDFIESFSYRYAKFIECGVKIRINNELLNPKNFENWAYPKENPPRASLFSKEFENEGTVNFEIWGGLILDRDAEKENYGVYFYCNDRLICRDEKNKNVGFISGLAGIPHPDASLCRVIVKLSGPAKLMPWNSSKTDINYNHLIFQFLSPTMLNFLKHYSSLSRRLKDNWKTSVFNRRAGQPDLYEATTPSQTPLVPFPPLPRVRSQKIEKSVNRNKEILEQKPYLRGIIESFEISDYVQRNKNYQTANRISLIIIDSSFEISLKDFIVYNTNLFSKREYDDNKIRNIFNNRSDVISHIRKKVNFNTNDNNDLSTIDYYYGIRCKIIHERTSVDITDHDIANFKRAVSNIIMKLHKISI